MPAIRGIVITLVLLAWRCLGQTDHPQPMTVGGGVNPVTLTANGTDSYVGNLPRPILSYQARVCYTFTPDVDNTGAATLALDGLAAKSLVRRDGSALEDGDFKADQPYVVCYASTGDNLVGIGVGASGGGGGGGGDPGGSNGNLQYKNGDAFGGVSGTSVSGSRITHGGKLDLGTGSLKHPNGTVFPTSCEVGDTFIKTNEPQGKNSFACLSPDTWTLQGDGGGVAGGGCASGPGIHIPDTGGPTCARGTATDPWAWGGLDFPNPVAAGTTCLNLETHAPTGWNGTSAPDLQMTYSRSDSTFTAGNKFLMSAKTWYLPDDAVVGAESDFSTPAWNTEVLNDVSPTGSDVLGLNQKYTTTIRGLNLGTSPNHADPKRKMMIQVCRQSTGAGGRTDSLPATIRITDAMLRWTTGSRVTSTVGTTAAGTSVTVATVHGAVNNSNQKIIILGAGAAGANYVGTVASFSGTTLTVSPATVTSVPADTLVAFEASLFDFTWNFTGTGPDAANGTGGGSGASQLWDDVREWTATNGTACNISGVNLPVSSVATCSVNAGADPESGIQFPDNSSAANCVYLRTKGPPTWDSSTAPSLLLTAAQIGAGTGNILFRASTWSIQEGVTYNSPSYVQTDCTVATGAGDLKKQTIVCPDLSITGAAAGRAMKIRICRAGTSDSITVPVKIFESAMRWTITNACPAP